MTFTSCQEQTLERKLVGEWLIVKASWDEGIEYYQEDKFIWEFTADHKAYETQFGKTSYMGTWVIKKDTLSFVTDYDLVYKIINLTSSKLILTHTYSEVTYEFERQ